MLQEDPAWRGAVASAGRATGGEDDGDAASRIPAAIAADRQLFRELFPCPAYVEALALGLPSALVPTVEEIEAARHPDGPACLGDEIWLNVYVGGDGSGWELTRFEIRWKDRIQTTEPVAFLFPMTTYAAIRLADDNVDLRYYLEAEGTPGDRARQLRLDGLTDEPRHRQMVTELCRCLGEPEDSLRDERLTLAAPAPHELVNACARQAGFRIGAAGPALSDDADGEAGGGVELRVTELAAPSGIRAHEGGELRLDCAHLGQEYRSKLGCSEPDGEVSVPRFGFSDGFYRAVVYVPDRAGLAAAVEELKALRVESTVGTGEMLPPLRLHEVYEAALARYNYLSGLVGLLRTHLERLVVVTYLALLVAQIGVVVGHRREHFGVFLARGVGVGNLVAMVATQVALSYVVAFVGAWFAVRGIGDRLSGAVLQLLAEPWLKLHVISDAQLVVLTPAAVFDLGAKGLVLGCVIAAAVVGVVVGLHRRPEPAALLYS